MSGATVSHVGASVCLGICEMDGSKRYIWDFDFFNFIVTHPNGGMLA